MEVLQVICVSPLSLVLFCATSGTYMELQRNIAICGGGCTLDTGNCSTGPHRTRNPTLGQQTLWAALAQVFCSFLVCCSATILELDDWKVMEERRASRSFGMPASSLLCSLVKLRMNVHQNRQMHLLL